MEQADVSVLKSINWRREGRMDGVYLAVIFESVFFGFWWCKTSERVLL